MVMSNNQKLEIKAALTMRKPVHEVFETIADPSKMHLLFSFMHFDYSQSHAQTASLSHPFLLWLHYSVVEYYSFLKKCSVF
jgi:hypothetical protein